MNVPVLLRNGQPVNTKKEGIGMTNLIAPTMTECLQRQADFQAKYPFHIFSNSNLSTYLKCPRLYYYQYVLGVEPVDYFNWNLKFGSIVHDAAAVYTQAMQRGISDAKQAAMTHLLNQDWEPATKTKCYSSAVTFLEQIIRWLGEGDKIILSSEQIFAKRLNASSIHDTLPIFYVGTIDLIYKIEDGIVVVDYKTKSRIMNFFYYNAPMDRQFIMYLWLAQKTGRFEVVILHCVNSPTLIPHQFDIPDHVIEEAVQHTKIATQEALNAGEPEHPSHWVKSCTECLGSWGCNYIDLCLRPEQSLQTKKLDGFQIKDNEKQSKEAEYLRKVQVILGR